MDYISKGYTKDNCKSLPVDGEFCCWENPAAITVSVRRGLFLKLKFPRFFCARQNSNFTQKSLFLRQRDGKKFSYFFVVVPSPFGSILTAIKGILYQEIWHLNVVLSPHTKNSQKTSFLVLLVKVTVIFFKCKKPSFRFPLYRTQNRKGRTKEKFNNKCFWLASSFPAKIAPHFFSRGQV